MSKTIKIIDLLNKIANGELKRGTRIIFDYIVFLYDYPNTWGIYKEGYETTRQNDFYYYIDTSNLNKEVEIIEEQEEIDIQKILMYDKSKETNIWSKMWDCEDKLNELVRAVKQLDKEKEDKK